MINAGTIEAIQNTMRRDDGVDGDAQRLGQMVWMIFLKVFDDHEREWAALDPSYSSPIPGELRWRTWAENPEGITGERLLGFVDQQLFPGLKQLATRNSSSAAAMISDAFEDTHNYMKSGQLMRQVINRIQRDLDFNRSQDRHVFGDLYEQLLHGLQAAGDAGEFYTPRAVTQLMVDVTDPQLGETVLDPACGTGGFLTSALEHVRSRYVRTGEDEARLQGEIRGVEKKPLPHLLCTTNMILHGVDVPSHIRHDNTLARPLRDWASSDRVDVVLTNPPFRGMEQDGIENNFPSPFKTRETADLFLLLVIHLLKPGGRAAIVLPDSSLFGEDIKLALRKKLLSECDVHTIVRLPQGVFAPYAETVRTNLVFFTKGAPTKEIWYYEHVCPFGDKYTKTKPIRHEDFGGLREWWEEKRPSRRAWLVTMAEIERCGFNLDIGNPSQPDYRAELSTVLETRASLSGALENLSNRMRAEIDSAPWYVGPRIVELVTTIAQLAPHGSMGAGVVEHLRTAITELALSGELSQPEPEDEDVQDTLARYVGAPHKIKTGLHVKEPFTIPDTWKWKRLAELTDFRIGRTPSTKDPRYWLRDPGTEGFAWTSISDMPRRGLVEETGRRVTQTGVDESFKSPPTPAGTLLVAFKLSVGKTAILGIDSYHNEAIASLAADDEVLKQYLLWALPAVAAYAASNPAMMGTTLNSKSIASLWVPVPPRQEQHRIVEGLRWLSTLVERIAGEVGEVQDLSTKGLKLVAQHRAISSWAESTSVSAR